MITLTDADNGQPLDVSPDMIGLVRVFDARRTEITLKTGEKIEVRETRRKVHEMMRLEPTDSLEEAW